jgi:hypothetical protein
MKIHRLEHQQFIPIDIDKRREPALGHAPGKYYF